MLFTLGDIHEDFGRFVGEWFGKAERLGPVYDLYFATAYGSPAYLDDRFLSLVQGVEAYHRRALGTTELPDEEHERRIEEVVSTAPDAHRNWLRGQLVYSNEPGLRKRLAEILRRDPEVMKPIFGDNSKKRDGFMYKVVEATTGMREGELLGLKWADVDLLASPGAAGALRVRRTLTRHGGKVGLGEPKTKKSRRTVRLTPRAVEALKSHRARQAEEKLKAGSLYEDNGLVFAGEGGGLINPSNLRQRSFLPLLERAGLAGITFHDLRHTCASLLFQRNVHPKFVQELLGHSSVSITLDTYSHMLPGMGGEAADAMGDALG